MTTTPTDHLPGAPGSPEYNERKAHEWAREAGGHFHYDVGTIEDIDDALEEGRVLQLRQQLQIVREETERMFNFMVDKGVKPTIAATDACNLMSKAAGCLDSGSRVRTLFRDMLEHIHRVAKAEATRDGRKGGRQR